MLRFSQRSCGGIVYPTVLGFLGVEVNRHDVPADSPLPNEKDRKRLKNYTPLKGWDALKRMFTFQEPYGLSLEMLSCTQLGLCATVSGFIIGGIDNTKFTVREFKENNQATIYENTYQAQRSVQDKVSKDFLKGGIRFGTKCGSFLFVFSTITTAISVYRGKSSVTDFTAAGAITGAMFTMNRGLPGSFSGGLVGLVLGTLGGAVVCAAMWACEVDVHEIRHWQYAQFEKRRAIENRAYLAEREGEEKAATEDAVAFAIMTPEEREKKTRILDKLGEVARVPEKPVVEIPELPPNSLFRNDKSK